MHVAIIDYKLNKIKQLKYNYLQLILKPEVVSTTKYSNTNLWGILIFKDENITSVSCIIFSKPKI